MLVLFLLCIGPVANASPTPGYPAHWWASVPKDGAPSWEVLPQEAGPGEVILSKRNELGLLSNFAATPFELHGKQYASLEGFWQMMMYPESAEDPRAKAKGLLWKYTREQVARMTAFDAKSAGDLAWDNMKKMGINWVTFEGRRLDYYVARRGEHYDLIVEATQAKIAQNAKARYALLSTGELKLRPDHRQPADAPPSWRYFEILMRIREDLKHKQDATVEWFKGRADD